MKKKLVINLVDGDTIEKNISDVVAKAQDQPTIGAPANDGYYASLVFSLGQTGIVHADKTNKDRLVYITPGGIKSIEVVFEP